MSLEILEKMQVKPQVEVRKPVVFKLGQVKTLAVLDKREEKKVNREEILERLKNYRMVKQNIIEPDKPKKKKIRLVKKKKNRRRRRRG